MKKHVFFAGILTAAVLVSFSAVAQKSENREDKTKEIIIRKKGDKTTKTTIEIAGDSILVNGKPLSDYKGDDVSVLQGDLMRDRSRHFWVSPENNEDMDINVFDNDTENGESRTFLGVVTEKTADGVKITNVVKGSAAEKAGFLKDDIITSLNDKKISSPEDLMEGVKSYKPGDNVTISYLRNNKKKDVKVKLGETKGDKRTFFYKNRNGAINGNGFNFKMPPMPDMPDFPDRHYNYDFKFRNNSRPRLGIKIEDTENSAGVKILSVDEGSAADKAGLKKDDIITSVNGEKVSSVDEIKEQLEDANDKESLDLKAKRNNSEMNFEIKIPKQLKSADL